MTKYIFVTGGVLSGLGKGVTAASIGNLLVSQGFSVWMQKFDQYLNVDAGTLNPNEHGEVFVLDDGAETDLDLGHYERFINTSLNRTSSVMSGQIYQAILENERQGKYLGKTIQMIPHVTDEVKSRIYKAAKESKCDILITEIGGTIGDYEGTHFVEAIRQMKREAGAQNVLYVHVGFIPYLGASEELKSKPLQNSVHDISGMGIQPDIVIARADHPVEKLMLKKIALFTGIDEESIIPLETVDSIYKVPQILQKYNAEKIIAQKLKLKTKSRNNHKWNEFIKKIDTDKKKTVKIALIAKYMGLKDTYFSVTESLKIAGIWQGAKVQVDWIDSEELEKCSPQKAATIFKVYDGILVPGGFGSRGIEGKICAIKYAREHKKPFLGLCYGMQLATIEFARNVAGLKDANTTEVDPKTSHPVIHIMPDQEKKMLVNDYGGTMRLGAYPCKLVPDTKTYQAYKSLTPNTLHLTPISERHRHRFEFNNDYREILEKKGLVVSGASPDNLLVEIIELKNHPFFIATQFHPEFLSRPLKPHPLFVEFIKSALR